MIWNKKKSAEDSNKQSTTFETVGESNVG
jgi:hypothetical protein